MSDPMRKVVGKEYVPHAINVVYLLTLECGHKVRWCKRLWNSRMERKEPKRKRCPECGLDAVTGRKG